MQIKFQLYLPLFLISLMLLGCQNTVRVSPDTKVTRVDHNITDYDAIDVSNAFQVEIVITDTENVTIEANENIHPYVEVFKSGSTLVVKLKNNTNIRGAVTLHAYVSAKHMNDFSASGASRILINDSIIASEVNVDLSGASYFSGLLRAGSLDAHISGASQLVAAGPIVATFAHLSGASILQNFDCSVDILNLDMSGASKASLTVNSVISINASGASHLYYKGNATVQSQTLSGGSAISKVN